MIVAAVVVVALIGAGAGYFFLRTVEIDVKDSFEVGDKHTIVTEEFHGLKIKKIIGEGDDLEFEVLVYEGFYSDTLTYSYADLKEEVEERGNMLFFNDSDLDADTTVSEKRIDTDFGKRNCKVYTTTLKMQESTDDAYEQVTKSYMGKDNNVLYKITVETPFSKSENILNKSSLIIESQTEAKVKDVEDLKVGDGVFIDYYSVTTDEISKVTPAEGENPAKYNIKYNPGDRTYDEVLEYLNLIVMDYLIEDAVKSDKTETVKTPLGRVVCDVYIDSETEMKLYVSNDIFVKAESDNFSWYWEDTDFIVKK